MNPPRGIQTVVGQKFRDRNRRNQRKTETPLRPESRKAQATIGTIPKSPVLKDFFCLHSLDFTSSCFPKF